MAGIPTDRNQYIERVDSNFVTPCVSGTTITIPSIAQTIIKKEDIVYPTGGASRYSFGNTKIEITQPNGVVYNLVENNVSTGSQITVLLGGVYEIRYMGTIVHSNTGSGGGSNFESDFTVAFYITVVQNYEPLPRWNIASVIDRVLDLAEPHVTDAEPRFKLDPAQRAMFEKIESPEFAFTNKTLKEILDQIGGFIHGIPRLIKNSAGVFNTVHFDMLGDTEQAELADPKYPYVTEIHAHNIESYATDIDSTAENFVNTLDVGEGSVTEPYAGGWRSVRSEQEYVRITESNMVIETTLPIYSVQKLEVLVPPTKATESYIWDDITGYVFEGSEYGRLSSYDGVFPTSKAFAIYYELGQKNIKGLNYESPTVIGGAGALYSIANIIKTATGRDISADWWNFGVAWDEDAGNYPRLAFRITYTPVFSARVLQHKPTLDTNALPRTLIYNQGANLIETRYYGENLKGAIARMGNPEFIRTYVIKFGRLHLIPKPGKMWGDDYFVTSTTNAMYADHVVCTVGMSKDFNRLSQYIGINSEWRAYEISEKSAYNRNMVYRDFVLLDDNPPFLGSNSYVIANSDLIYKSLKDTFTQSSEANPSITAAVVKSYQDGVNEPISTVTVPVVSSAFGNSLQFAFGMRDNFSAGDQSIYHGSDNAIGYWQTDVQYPDYYGRIDTVDFKLTGGDGKSTNGSTEFTVPNGDLGGEYVYVSPSATLRNRRMTVKKNNTEIMRYNYQLDFAMHKTAGRNVASMRNIIMGPALTHNSPLIRPVRSDHSAALYVVQTKIGKFQSAIDTASATQIKSYADGTGIEIIKGTIFIPAYLKFTPQASTATGKAWAIADSATGEILLAYNTEIAEGDSIEIPNMFLAHLI